MSVSHFLTISKIIQDCWNAKCSALEVFHRIVQNFPQNQTYSEVEFSKLLKTHESIRKKTVLYLRTESQSEEDADDCVLDVKNLRGLHQMVDKWSKGRKVENIMFGEILVNDDETVKSLENEDCLVVVLKRGAIVVYVMDPTQSEEDAEDCLLESFNMEGVESMVKKLRGKTPVKICKGNDVIDSDEKVQELQGDDCIVVTF